MIPLHPDVTGLARVPRAAGPQPGVPRGDGRRRRIGWRSTGWRTTPARRSTCTPRSASSTTPGPASGPTTSTGARGPTTPSCRAVVRRHRGGTPGRCGSRWPPSTSTGSRRSSPDGLEQVMADCVDPAGLFDAYAACRGPARRLARAGAGRRAAAGPAATAAAAAARPVHQPVGAAAAGGPARPRRPAGAAPRWT